MSTMANIPLQPTVSQLRCLLSAELAGCVPATEAILFLA